MTCLFLIYLSVYLYLILVSSIFVFPSRYLASSFSSLLSHLVCLLLPQHLSLYLYLSLCFIYRLYFACSLSPLPHFLHAFLHGVVLSLSSSWLHLLPVVKIIPQLMSHLVTCLLLYATVGRWVGGQRRSTTSSWCWLGPFQGAAVTDLMINLLFFFSIHFVIINFYYCNNNDCNF